MHKERLMREPIAAIEWQIAESDADWERLYIPSTPEQTPAADPPPRLKRYLTVVGALLVALIGAGGWGWRTDLATLPQPAVDVRTQQEPGAMSHYGDRAIFDGAGALNATDWWYQYGRDVAQPIIEFQGDWAVTGVIQQTAHGQLAYRRARFYRRTDAGWLQTEPDATLWGPERSLETPYFVYHFRQTDAPAVIAVAPQIDTLYATMRRDFGLPPIGAEKLVIEVSVTHSPVYPLFQRRNPERFVMDDRLVVASPALSLAPAELTDADLLAQSIALPLLEIVSKEASERYRIGASWQPVLKGLRLWQVWNMDLPLSAWREDLVHWVYFERPGASLEQRIVLPPEQYEQLCASHALWMEAPTMLGIPLLCNELDWEVWYVETWGPRHLPTRLNQILLPPPDGYPYEGTPAWGQSIALATLVEYAVATYGRERLPALVTGLGQYNTWDTLLLAVYGVSATDFEAGWQAYLAAHY
jgi:hypothetical protein